MREFLGRDKVEFAKVMAALSTAFNREIDEETVRIYEMALADMPIGKIKQKALKHIQESKFFPRVAELRPSASRYAIQWRKRAAISASRTRQEYLESLNQGPSLKQLRLEGPKSLGELVK